MVSATQCPEGTYPCNDGLRCYSNDESCDGENYCPDGTDENPDMCKGAVDLLVN